MKANITKLTTAALLTFLLGQVSAQGLPDWYPLTFTANLTSDRANLRDITATAHFVAILTGNQLAITGTLHDVGDLAAGVGIFTAPPGETGPQLELQAVTGSYLHRSFLTLVEGTEDTISAALNLTDEQVADLKAGLLYIQVFPRRSTTGTLIGHLSSPLDFSLLASDASDRELTPEDLVGVWMFPGDKSPLTGYEGDFGPTDAIQFLANGRWRILQNIEQASAEHSPTHINGTWEFRDSILSLNFISPGAAFGSGGQAAFYERLHEDGSRSSLVLQSLQIWGEVGSFGAWMEWGQNVGP